MRRSIGLLSAAVLMIAALSALRGCAAVSYASSGGVSAAETAAPARQAMQSGRSSSVQARTVSASRSKRRASDLGEAELRAYFDIITQQFSSSVSFDIGASFDTSRPFAEEISSHSGLLLGLGEKYRDSAEAALMLAVAAASRELGVPPPPAELNGELPSWQLAAALTWACGREDAAGLLRRSVKLELDFEGETLRACAVTADFTDAVAERQTSERFSAEFVYTYYLTVFNDDLTPAEYRMQWLSPRYLKTIGLPLDYMFYYDSWYGPRQYSTRMHLGMDVHARKDSNIYSCTDGKVAAIGWDDTAGYYVVVEDPFGYEYHYYHMIRLTDFLREGDTVSRGQLIGHVGKTGNSDGNHLHLSIITPRHVHLNPYAVMCTVRDISEG